MRKNRQFRKKNTTEDDEEHTTPNQTQPVPSAEGKTATTTLPTSSTTVTPTLPSPTEPTQSVQQPTPTTTHTKKEQPAIKKEQPASKVDKSKPPPIPVKPAMLSFDDEEGEDEFQVKKTIRSKKMAKEQEDKKSRPFQRDVTPIVSTATMAATLSAGEYTPDRLNELRKNAISFSAHPSAASSAGGVKSATSVSVIHDDEDSADFAFSSAPPDIPTAAQIQAAKSRRTKMREGKDDGFISLDSRDEGSRLIREEDEDEAAPEEFGGDYDKKRVAFGDPGKDKWYTNGTSKRGDAIVIGDDDASNIGDDDDDELHRWEMDQIKKGGGTTKDAAAALQRKQKQESDRKAALPRPSLDATLANMNLRKPTITMETITREVTSHLQNMQEKHAANKIQLTRVENDLSDQQERVITLEKELKQASEHYNFYQTMKGYVADLLDCLEAKAHEIEDCEEKLLRAEQTRAAARRLRITQKLQEGERAMQTVCDQLAMYPNALPPAYKNTERKGGDPAGWSSDEEDNPNDVKIFVDERESIYEEISEIFEDVDEDFSTIEAVRAKFQDWKLSYATTYKQAYVSMSIPHLFAPFVRLELLRWSPMEKSAVSVEKMGWYNALFDYGIAEGAEIDANDKDINLVPNLIDKVVLPRVNASLSNVWDPFSRSQSLRAHTLVQEMLVFVSATESAEMRDTLTNILVSLQGAVDKYSLPQYPYALPRDTPQSNFPPFQYSQRQFWRGVKLISNVCVWQDVLTAGPLVQMVADNLINNKLVPFLKNVKDVLVVLGMCEKLVDNIPRDWLASAKGVPPAFLIFHDFVLRLPKRIKELPISKDNATTTTTTTTTTTKNTPVERAVRLLSRLGDYETAHKLAKEYGVKTAL